MKYTKQILVYLAIALLLACNLLWAENYALDFDGTDDYLDLGDNLPVLGSTFTQELWIYLQSGTNQQYHGLLGFEGTANAGYARVDGGRPSDGGPSSQQRSRSPDRLP